MGPPGHLNVNRKSTSARFKSCYLNEVQINATIYKH